MAFEVGPMLIEQDENVVDSEAGLLVEQQRAPLRTRSKVMLGVVAGVVALVGVSVWSTSRPVLPSVADAALIQADAESEESTTTAAAPNSKRDQSTTPAKAGAKTEEVSTTAATTASTTEEVATTTAKPEHVECLDITGVMLAQDDTKLKSVWPQCAQKWSEDCRQSGCCADWGMKCFEKDKNWAACNTECKKKDEKNETWNCNVVYPPKPRTFETCTAECKGSVGCKQAVYSSDASGSCKLTNESSTTIVWAADNVNSTICRSSKSELQKMGGEVEKQIPFELPREHRANCSWAGDDCSETKCCNEFKCTKDFSQCWGYACYKKDEYFSSCMGTPPPKAWDGKWIGGAREMKVLPPAGARAKVMGTSLYCFMVVAWDAPPAKPFWSPEGELVDNMKKNGASIFQCDGNDIFDGVQTPKAEWGSFSNIDAFQETWKKVKATGKYANFDWTVKVDSDAVLVPWRLKQHLDKLRVPAGARVYLENNDYRFKFMGALEIISKPAADIWAAESSSCIRGKHEGGEDFFMKGCMDALGIDRMIDHQLLHDKYGGGDVHCTDGWSAAYHFHKKVIRWNWCYNEIVCGSRGKTCDKGIDVEYVMDD